MIGKVSAWESVKVKGYQLPGGMSVKMVHSCPELVPQGKTPEYIVASSARTSFDNFELCKTDADDAKLITRLYKDKHTSPFEMATVTFLIVAPKFVTNHILRHRTFRFNESSQRYSKIKRGFFHPTDDPDQFIRMQHATNKQSSTLGKPSEELVEIFRQMESKISEIITLYGNALSLGAAKECARFALPVATMSSLAVQCDLHNLLKFCSLRMADDAQYETRLVARAMFLLAKQLFPITCEQFLKGCKEPICTDDASFIPIT
jgi:thymidylate synthase (FAD)